MFDFFENNLKRRKRHKLYRENSTLQSIDLTSNDYLGLSSHPSIRKQMITALEEGLALSSKASRLLGGTSAWHLKAEEALKTFINRPAVLSFSSGYQANLGLIPALAKERVLFSDELNHASLIDGIRLSQSHCRIFRHRDLDHLETLLKKEKGEKLIVTESLFSMEGDFSALEDLSQLALKYQALLVVDEAHSTGLFGESLGGLISDFKKQDHIVTVHTGGKALGSSGAFVGSSLLIKNYLVNNCRSFIYTTSPPPLLMLQWLAVLEVLKKEKDRALDLRKKSLQFRKDLGLNLSESPIVFIVFKRVEQALQAEKKLSEQGFFIKAVREPTVPKDKQGLRIILHYDHTGEQLNHLKKQLKIILEE